MDKKVEQFQADLLQSLREMKTGQAARATHVSKLGLCGTTRHQNSAVSARSNDAAMVELLRQGPEFANEYLAAALEEIKQPGGSEALQLAQCHVAEANRPYRKNHKKTIFGLTVNQRGLVMRYSSQIKPISYLKANAAEVLLQLAKQREPLVITQNGEAKAVLQDVASYEETQETLALLKVLALGNQDIAAGKIKPAADVIARLRAKHTGA